MPTYCQTLLSSIVTTAPVNKPVTVAELKSYQTIGFATDDTLIGTILDAAIAEVESYLGKSLITQTRKSYFRDHYEEVSVPYGPTQSVTSVKRIRQDTTTTLTLNSDYYLMGTANGDQYIKLFVDDMVSKGLYPPDHIDGTYDLEVVHVSGYGDDSTDVPADIRLAIMKLASTDYEYRNDLTDAESLMEAKSSALNKIAKYRSAAVLI